MADLQADAISTEFWSQADFAVQPLREHLRYVPAEEHNTPLLPAQPAPLTHFIHFSTRSRSPDVPFHPVEALVGGVQG